MARRVKQSAAAGEQAFEPMRKKHGRPKGRGGKGGGGRRAREQRRRDERRAAEAARRELERLNAVPGEAA